MVVKYKKLREGAKEPVRASGGAAGFDLFALCGEEGMVLPPMGRAVVPTGIALELPGPDVVGLVFPRSGLAVRHGVSLTNAVGVIDSDYRGELFVALVNLSEEPYAVRCGERIAQLIVMPVQIPALCETELLSDTPRGEGRFGSTGEM